MASGFLAGVFWGGVVGSGLLLVSSQTLDRQQLSFPRPEASAVEVPGGSEFDQAREDTDPVLPATEAAPGAEEIVVGVIPPEDVVDALPAFDTSSLDVPRTSVDGPAGLGDAPDVADGVTVPSGTDSARVGSAGSAGPALEAPVDPAASPSTDTSAPASPQAPEQSESDVAASEAIEPAPASETEIAALPADTPSETAPDIAASVPDIVAPGDAPAAPVSPEISESPSMPGVRTPGADERRIGADATARLEEVAPESPVAAPEAMPDQVVVAEPAPQPAPAETPAPEAVPETAEAAPAPQVMPAPEATPAPGSTGIVTVDGGDSQFFTPVETFENRADNVETNRLPTIAADDAQTGSLPVIRRLPGTPLIEEDTASADDAAETQDAGAVADGPAIRRFAMEYVAPAGASAISVVLVHDGDQPMASTDIAALPESVAFAVNAASPAAVEIAAAYRAAGREVVLIPSLPQGATPQDVEVALGTSLNRVPEAVAVMDVSGSSFQSDREAVAQVVAVVSDTGHGMITFPRGLNTAHQQAERVGVPTGLIFRILDEDGETSEQIRRTMDRAAFRARQSDAVILVGHTAGETLAAIQEWARGADAANVTLAPVSVALSPVE